MYDRQEIKRELKLTAICYRLPFTNNRGLFISNQLHNVIAF